MGLTAIRSPVAANTAFRLRSSGLPDLESILYVASRVSFALRAISAIPPCAWATWRSASMSACLVALLDNGLKVRGRFRRVLKLLDQPRLVRKASGGRAASFARCAPCNLRNTLWHG